MAAARITGCVPTSPVGSSSFRKDASINWIFVCCLELDISGNPSSGHR